jgi:hypothetical protein
VRAIRTTAGAIAAAGALLSTTPASATVQVSASAGYCDWIHNCEGAPQVFGRDATSQYSKSHHIGSEWLTDASLTVDFDGFSGYARASGQGQIEGLGTLGYTARSGGSVFDVLTVGSGGGAGTLRLTWHLLGSADVDDGDASFGILCGANPPALPCDTPLVLATADQLYDQPLVADLAITFGTPTQISLFPAASAQVAITSTGGTTPFSLSAGGTWSAELVSVQVLDALGQPQAGVPIASESGFDWAAVPEPEAGAGALAAALALAGVRARRRRP